jgi:hypothetical protein
LRESSFFPHSCAVFCYDVFCFPILCLNMLRSALLSFLILCLTTHPLLAPRHTRLLHHTPPIHTTHTTNLTSHTGPRRSPRTRVRAPNRLNLCPNLFHSNSNTIHRTHKHRCCRGRRHRPQARARAGRAALRSPLEMQNGGAGARAGGGEGGCRTCAWGLKSSIFETILCSSKLEA